MLRAVTTKTLKEVVLCRAKCVSVEILDGRAHLRLHIETIAKLEKKTFSTVSQKLRYKDVLHETLNSVNTNNGWENITLSRNGDK